MRLLRWRPHINQWKPGWRTIPVLLFGLGWTLFSTWLAIPWADALGDTLGNDVLAWLTIAGIAIVPGAINSILLASLAFERTPHLPPISDTDEQLPGLTVLVAAYNEEKRISHVLASIFASDYNGPLTAIVANDGSTDRTAQQVSAFQTAHSNNRVTLINVAHGGKSHALNQAMLQTTTPFIVTVDGDTRLDTHSLETIVRRIMLDDEVVAVAGSVVSDNARANWVTWMQAWDYYLGIASVKRAQNYFGNTVL